MGRDSRMGAGDLRPRTGKRNLAALHAPGRGGGRGARGKNVVIVTPTASGKTVCYNLPVLNAILENADARALYLFPTKALAQDQLAELHDLNQRLDGLAMGKIEECRPEGTAQRLSTRKRVRRVYL